MSAPLVGYLCAVMLHSLWNSSATLGGANTFLVVYFLVILPILAAMVALVVWQRRREQRVVAAQLPGMAAAGWIADSEVSLLSSLTGRRGWRAAVRKRAGGQAAKAVYEYQTAATELAFLRDAVEHGTAAGPEADERQRRLLETMLTARQAAVNAPDALRATRHHLDRRNP